MEENTKHFFKYLPACVIFAIAAAAGAWLFTAASDYITYPTAIKVYSVGWFAASVLSFYCGLLVVPRSLGIIFAFAGIVAFAILCALDIGLLSGLPLLVRQAIQSLPALFFIAAWATIAMAACKSENKKIRLSSWLWLMIFMLLLTSWGTFHYAQRDLLRQRNAYLREAREKTLALAAELDAYKQANNTCPITLEEAGVDPQQAELSIPEKCIHYKHHENKTDYALTFDDPMRLGKMDRFSYDTTQGGWFGQDPKDAVTETPCHMFLGFLRKR